MQKTRGFNPLHLFAFAHNGLKPHCYKKWIATPHAVCLTASARNDNFNYPYALKNNFAILNLVKTFLTSTKFTFDNLSRKIKNPCLVINKNSFFKEKIIMYNFKKLFTYMVVGALSLALSISCKSNEEPQATGETSSNHPSQGTYTNTIYNDSATVTINNNGTCTISGTAHFISGSTTEYKNFSITVTKWWYYYPESGSSITYRAGSSWEKSEATINSPATDYFDVSYYADSGELGISFGPEGKRYWTGNLTKQ